MPFVKLDCGILNSTLWFEREAREIFLTALLLAVPQEYEDPIPELYIDRLEPTGWSAPPGWYGFVPAAGPGIIHRSLLSDEEGKIGLQKLAEPDYGSRSQDFEGRRMVRIDGGFLILNYQKYREKDYTAAVRSKRYREKKAAQALLTSGDGSHAVASQNHAVSTRSVTQAEAEEYLILDTVSQEYLGPVQALSSQKKEGTGTKSRNHRFSPPSQPELIDYFLSKDFSELEARKCFNWYDSQGWKVGKNPMKNWKAAARGWMLRAEEMK